MYDIINDDKTYMFPNGKSYLGSEIKQLDNYKILSDTDNFGVDVHGSMITAVVDFASEKEMYGLSSDASIDDLNLARKKELKSQQIRIDHMASIYKTAQIFAIALTDEQALEVKDLYPSFEFDHQYKKDDRFIYNGHLFKVNQDHTSQEQWIPGETGTESLYTNLELNEGGYFVWKQPTGAHDAYNKGDIVEYNGELYKSLIDGNAYSPDAYPAGWEKYTEPTE